MKYKFDILKKTIPTQPGIYLMKNTAKKIIYIGKAKNLKKRVCSYFTKNQNYKTEKLLENIADIEYVLTDTESEAFLLESNMIKRYRPKYNIDLKDQQRYTYLRLTSEKYPRLLVTRRTRDGKFLGNGKVFGPFTHGSSKLLSIGTLRKSFQIRICKTLPKKACLEYHLGNCEAPCEFKNAQKNYSHHIDGLSRVLTNPQHLVTFKSVLRSKMEVASKHQQYEYAKNIRDTIYRLDNLTAEQKMETISGSDEEYFGIDIVDDIATIMTFRQIRGVIQDSDRFSFEILGDNMFSNFLYQYYTTRKIPNTIIINVPIINKKLLEVLLSGKSDRAVKINLPSGKQKKLMSLLLKNIQVFQTAGTEPGLVELKQLLHITKIPKIIECFDISNHGSDFAVGSMSRFSQGIPDKSGYRKFKIKTIRGRDDFAMIGEIVKRRYTRLKNQSLPLPDLILVDGGKGQLNAAYAELKKLNLSIPCISIAKENEEIYTVGKSEPLIISRDKKSLQILQFARDESHRFGVSYNRHVQKMNII